MPMQSPDIAFRVTFSPYANGQQSATVRRATGQQAASDDASGEIIIENAPVSFGAEAQVTHTGDYAFFAGSRSDPFFFDLMGFCNNFKFTGTDYFLDKDVFGIVLEVPNSALGEHATVGLWSRVLWSHHDDWLQVARLGLPLVNILFNAEAEKDLFNRSEPAQQKALFLAKVAAQLESMGNSAGKAQELAQVFIPDILHYDSSSSAGFLNGRKLTDDVVDIILNLVTAGKVTTDSVAAAHRLPDGISLSWTTTREVTAMSTLSRRNFLALTGAGIVAVAVGGVALARQFTQGQGNKLNFQAVTGLPAKPMPSYASYVIAGQVDISNGTGTITKYVYAGPPEGITTIPLWTRSVRVTSVSQQGNAWHITGVVNDQGQLQKGEDTSFDLLLNASHNLAQTTFFGSPIQLQLQQFKLS